MFPMAVLVGVAAAGALKEYVFGGTRSASDVGKDAAVTILGQVTNVVYKMYDYIEENEAKTNTVEKNEEDFVDPSATAQEVHTTIIRRQTNESAGEEQGTADV